MAVATSRGALAGAALALSTVIFAACGSSGSGSPGGGAGAGGAGTGGVATGGTNATGGTGGSLGLGCDALDVSNPSDLTVKDFFNAAISLKSAALALDDHWSTVCNALNAELGLDTSKPDVAGACAVLDARVKSALQGGATVSTTAIYECLADVNIQAACQAQCAAVANCNIEAACSPAELGGTCAAACSGSCSGISVPCTGSCSGTCTPQNPSACTGVCEGSCTSFSGSCTGNCNGTCDGQATSGSALGNCSGQCAGTCTGGTATGSCGQCTGACSAQSGQCAGTCTGVCSATPVTCTGQCEGGCSVAYTAPYCAGMPSCGIDANCQACCDADAAAHSICGGAADIEVYGDPALWAAFAAHAKDIAQVSNMTVTLKDPITRLAAQVAPAIQASSNITAAGTVCMVAEMPALADAQAALDAAVVASASLNGQGGA